jgi:hypothetical protein
MNKMITSFRINERDIILPVEADRIEPGCNKIQFLEDDSPAKHATWAEQGYTVIEFLSRDENILVKSNITDIIKKYLIQLNIDVSGFSLEKYHTFVTTDQHLTLIEKIRAGSQGIGGIPFDNLAISTDRLDKELSQICNVNVTCRKLFNLGDNKTYEVGHFFVRIVRPGTSKDNNPPHKDTHIDRLRNAVNLYYPIAGSNTNSSLPIIPGSHLWSEQEIVRTHGETLVNGSKYNVPAIVAASRGLNLITPNPNYEQAMVFTPYAIHGGGINFNTDTTRVSLEIRFWKN